MFQKDQHELSVVGDLSMYDFTATESLVSRIERLLATDAAKIRPDIMMNLIFTGRISSVWARGDLKATVSVLRPYVVFRQ